MPNYSEATDTASALDQEAYGVVLVTTSSQAEAEAIASALVVTELAACVNIIPVQSIYRWDGKIQNDQEWQLIIKTNLSQFKALEAKVIELHSYELPEIIALPITTGSPSYLSWIGGQVAK